MDNNGKINRGIDLDNMLFESERKRRSACINAILSALSKRNEDGGKYYEHR